MCDTYDVILLPVFVFKQESLPLINVFRTSLEDDSRYAMNSNTTFNLQVTHKILEVSCNAMCM